MYNMKHGIPILGNRTPVLQIRESEKDENHCHYGQQNICFVYKLVGELAEWT